MPSDNRYILTNGVESSAHTLIIDEFNDINPGAVKYFTRSRWNEHTDNKKRRKIKADKKVSLVLAEMINNGDF